MHLFHFKSQWNLKFFRSCIRLAKRTPHSWAWGKTFLGRGSGHAAARCFKCCIKTKRRSEATGVNQSTSGFSAAAGIGAKDQSACMRCAWLFCHVETPVAAVQQQQQYRRLLLLPAPAAGAQ
eukprot:365707-Chlamydomonas_euryale.AAC.42